MDPITLLMNEHRRIERVLQAALGYADRLRGGGTPPSRSDLADIVEFIRGYADSLHHGKEEEILFAAMCRHGFSDRQGPIAVMLADHTAGRGFVAILREIASAQGEWTAEERTRAATALADYGTLLTDHIQKEDQVLYPMARSRLPEEEYAEVARRCAEFEAARAQDGSLERLRVVGDRLIAEYATGGA